MSKEIILTRGYVALVDDEDYDWLSQWKWFAHYNKYTNSYYAVRSSSKLSNEKRHTIRMHRVIMCAPDDILVDHKNRNTLDNRRDNLRFATNSQNVINTGLTSKNTSGYKGVDYHKHTGKWRARISVNNKLMHLGLFDSPEKAFSAYKSAALMLHGEFARFSNEEEE